MKKTIDLGLTIEIEYPNSCSGTVHHRIFEATKGEGDIRKGINMNANISWYVANKIQENLNNQGLDHIKIGNSGIHIKEVKEIPNE